MGNTKRYKLYKSGKMLVIGAVAVTGVAISSVHNQVSADTTSDTDTQAVQTTDATQDDKQVTLTASSTDTTTDTTATDTEKTETVKSDVPTSVASNATQDEAKKSIDNAQETVKTSADNAKNQGVEVTQGGTKEVTLNDGNAVSKSNEILTDLNKQDEALKQATATQQANQKAYETATTQHDETVKQGQADLSKATNDLNSEVDSAKKSGLDVTEKQETVTPKYKDLKGLTGQALLEAMQYNIAEYQKAIDGAVASETQDTKTILATRQQYEKAVAEYNAEKARVDKANADKKAAYEKALNDFMNGVNNEKYLSAKTSTDNSSGQYETFMTSEVNQSTGEFTLKHDMNDGVHVIGNGELKGKIDSTVTSNGDGTETVTITGIHLYSYTYVNHYQNQAVNQNINFHVYDLNGNELYSVYHNGNTSFSNNINKYFALNKSITLAVGQKSDDVKFLTVDDNWIWNTHGNVSIAFKNTNSKPTEPTYEQDPTAPAVPKVTETTFTVIELPAPEAPENQKVSFNLYKINTTPAPIPKAPTPATPETPKVVEQSALPTTNAKDGQGGLLGLVSMIAGFGLLGAMGKKFKKQQ